MNSSVAGRTEQVVDTDRYPISAPETPAWWEAVERVRQDLERDGCSVLPDFVRGFRHDELRREGSDIAPHAHYDVEVVNAYNISTDTALPEGHPAHITMQRRNAFVARDHIPARSIIHQLYTDPNFQRFLAACFGLPEIYELADPLAGLVLNVVRPGMDHPWHFDTNEFAVTLLTQAPESGGVFEYCPGIRSENAENFADVRSVLTRAGDHLIRRLSLRTGDLQLFKGRFALHRVTPVEGPTERHTAIFAYSARPGVVGSVARTRQLFGRVTPEHLAERQAVRGDRLLD
ncbi:arpA protein [Saccharomonospora sp.]|uniref:HalD/BesD family halogenase n=1 Tax=Saccharomonospora sp. TaxID=33913 RepID=UPI002622258F|nr:arpA protein [Saccharomonospora sp.]